MEEEQTELLITRKEANQVQESQEELIQEGRHEAAAGHDRKHKEPQEDPLEQGTGRREHQEPGSGVNKKVSHSLCFIFLATNMLEGWDKLFEK